MGCQRFGSKISETKFSFTIRGLSYFAASAWKRRTKLDDNPSFPTQVPKHRREVKWAPAEDKLSHAKLPHLTSVRPHAPQLVAAPDRRARAGVGLQRALGVNVSAR